jgi:predicted regulator of Ras-like GTPase activity (Roadblock/LC7/MglB family)
MVVYDDDLPHDSYDAEAELAALASAASAVAERLNIAPLNTIILETNYMTYIIAAIVPGYYGVIGVQAGSLGPARFALREMVERLVSEL